MRIIPSTKDRPAFIELDEEDEKRIAEIPPDFFLNVDKNRAGKLSVEVDHLHHVIQELNEALVTAMHYYELDRAIEPEDEQKIAVALALVPEQDRKGGTWRME